MLTGFMRHVIITLFCLPDIHSNKANTKDSTSQIIVERKLNKLIQDYQNGKHEGSIMTVATVESLSVDDKQTWRAIRKELEDIGVSVAAFDANRSFILDWFRNALVTGAFEEQGPVEEQQLIEDSESVWIATPPASYRHSNIDGHKFSAGAVSVKSPVIGGVSEMKPFEPPPERDEGPKTYQYILRSPSGKRQITSPKLSTPLESSSIAALETPQTSNSIPAPNSAVRTIPNPLNSRPRIGALFSRVLRRYDHEFLIACRGGDIHTAAELLKRGANINAEKGTAVLLAACGNDIPTLELLLVAGAKIYRDTINIPIDLGHDQVVELLLQHGCKPGSWALPHAVGNGKYHTAEILLSHGVKGTDEVLRVSVENEITRIVELVLESGVKPSVSCLHIAVKKQNLQIVKLLLHHKVDIDGIFGNSTALFKAVNFPKEAPALVHLLLEGGANHDIKPYRGGEFETPLHVAAQRGHILVTKDLLDHGADPEMRFTGFTALLLALFKCHDQMAQLLIERGASIHATSPSGHTALHLAVLGSCKVALRLLLDRDAELEAKDQRGYTALDLAVTSEDPTMLKMLLDKGARNNHATYSLKFENEEVAKGYEYHRELLRRYPHGVQT